MARLTRTSAPDSLLVPALVLLLGLLAAPLMAEEIDVANYGVAQNGFPFALAMGKGFYKELGADITAIRSSSGGGTTIRNLLAGSMPYGEVSIDAAVLAILRGTDLRIIHQTTYATAVAWVTMPNSPIKSLQDIKGKRLGYTNPQSTSQSLDTLLLETQKLTPNDVKMVSTGGFGEGLTLLEHDGIDVMPVGEPLFTKSRGKYRVLAWARDALPPLAQNVGVTTSKTAQQKPELIRAVLAAHRKAVEYMNAQPQESAEVIAKAYELPVDIIASILDNLMIKKPAKAKSFWVTGKFDYESMDSMVRASRLVGLIKEDVDWSKMVDESYLPADLRSKR